MKRKWNIPDDAAEQMARAPTPGPLIWPQEDIFDFEGFIQVLLVEHLRDLKATPGRLELYSQTLMGKVRAPGRMLNTQFAVELIEDMRRFMKGRDYYE
jgi:hypothetical protein